MGKINELIAGRLQAARRDFRGGKKLTLKEIAAKSGVPYSTIQRISKAETDPQISNLLAIANALEIDLIELISDQKEHQSIFENTSLLTEPQKVLVQELINNLTAGDQRKFFTTAEVMQMKRDQELAHISQLESAKNK